SAAVGDATQHFADFGFVDEAVAVLVNAVEALLDQRGRFVLGDFAVAVGVSPLELFAELFGIHAAGAALAGTPLGIWRSRRSAGLTGAGPTFAWTIGRPTTGRAAKNLVGR